MPRTVDEVEAEMSKLRGEGVHHASGQMKVLREELKALVAVEAPSDLPAPVIQDSGTATAGSGIDLPTADPLDNPEWRFIEKFISNIKVESNGQNGHVASDLYQNLLYALNIWRTARRIALEVGPGGKFPPFSELGIKRSDGSKVEPKPVVALPALPVPAPTVDEGAMPTRASRPSNAEILATVTGGDPRSSIRRELESRPEPLRAAEPAAV